MAKDLEQLIHNYVNVIAPRPYCLKARVYPHNLTALLCPVLAYHSYQVMRSFDWSRLRNVLGELVSWNLDMTSGPNEIS